MTSKNTAIDSFFKPRSIAVVGASSSPQKLGYVVLDNLQRAGYRGRLYPVNQNEKEILGLRSYPAMSALNETPDLAIVVVPARAVAGVLGECGQSGVRSAVVITAGFRETGESGLTAEQELLASARRYAMRVIGPNSVGIINTAIGLNATFAETAPVRYDVGMLSQSGAVASAILDWAHSIGLGFSKFVSLGNMADLTDVDFLEFLGADSETKIIVEYLESIPDGRRLMEIARQITPRKPIIAIKVGGTDAGAHAAASHTGALASRDVIVEAAFRQVGIIRAYTMEELFDYTLCFAYAPLPAGPRVAVVTNAGGPGVMAADAIEHLGLGHAELTRESREAIRSVLPAAASTGNPIDVLGDADAHRYQVVLDVVCNDANVDAVIVMLTPQRVTEPERTAQVVSYAAREQAKPIVAVFMGGGSVGSARTLLDDARVPVYAYPERAVRALAALTRYGEYRRDVGQG